MPASIVYSNDLSLLADRLIADIDSASGGDPFATAYCIIPNRNLSRWIELYLARSPAGICGGIEFLRLEQALQELVAAKPQAKVSSFETKDAMRFSQTEDRILALLQIFNDDTGGAHFNTLAGYWLDAPVHIQSGRRIALYQHQLAERLAVLFEEYERHRQTMVQSWLKQDKEFDKETILNLERSDPEAAWIYHAQQELYMRMHLLLHGLPGTDKKSFFAEAQACLVSPDLNVPWPALHMFGLSQISDFHLSILARLADEIPVYLYFQDACMLWPQLQCGNGAGQIHFRKYGLECIALQSENISTNRTQVSFTIKQQATPAIEPAQQSVGRGSSTPAFDNLVALWAGPGAGMLAQLSRHLMQASWLYIYKPKIKTTQILHSMQQQMFENSAAFGEERQPDASLMIAGAPGQRREVETVHQCILHLMQTHSDLSLHEIVVLVPDMNRYRTSIRSVFDAAGTAGLYGQYIPYNLSDYSAVDESLIAKAAQSLFELLATIVGNEQHSIESPGYHRTEIFELFMNPACQAACAITADEVRRWLDLLDDLQAYQADRGRGSFHLGLALRRLRLGSVLETENLTREACLLSEDLLEDSELSRIANMAPAGRGSMISRAEIGRLSFLLEDLARRALHLRELACQPVDFMAELAQLCRNYLAAPLENPDEEIILKNLLSGLRRIAGQPQMLRLYQLRRQSNSKDQMDPANDATQALDLLSLAREFVLGRLRGLDASQGKYLGGGVTIAALQPMRPIPFRFVFILGLNDVNFPGKVSHSTLDLRDLITSQKIALSEHSLPERNQFLFLETFLAVQDALILLYNKRDLVKDRENQSSAVLQQLRQSAAKFCRFDQIGKEGLYPECLLPFHLGDSLPEENWRSEHAGLRVCFHTAQAAGVNAVPRRNQDFLQNIRPTGQAQSTQYLRISQLVNFLIEPAAETLRTTANLGDPHISEANLYSDEPRTGDPLTRSHWIYEAMRKLLVPGQESYSPVAVREVFAQAFNRARLQAATPQGHFARFEFEDQQERLLQVYFACLQTTPEIARFDFDARVGAQEAAGLHIPQDNGGKLYIVDRPFAVYRGTGCLKILRIVNSTKISMRHQLMALLQGLTQLADTIHQTGPTNDDDHQSLELHTLFAHPSSKKTGQIVEFIYEWSPLAAWNFLTQLSKQLLYGSPDWLYPALFMSGEGNLEKFMRVAGTLNNAPDFMKALQQAYDMQPDVVDGEYETINLLRAHFQRSDFDLFGERWLPVFKSMQHKKADQVDLDVARA